MCSTTITLHHHVRTYLLVDDEEHLEFLEELEKFIGKLLRLVEVELNFDFNRHGKISSQIHDMIQIHVESLGGLRKELKRLPQPKVRVRMVLEQTLLSKKRPPRVVSSMHTITVKL